MNTQVRLCARQFQSEVVVTPDTAADILLLADRHSLAQLKQVATNTNIDPDKAQELIYEMLKLSNTLEEGKEKHQYKGAQKKLFFLNFTGHF